MATIVKIEKMANGHLKLDLSDGSSKIVFRGKHEEHYPIVGDAWPPSGHEHVVGGLYNGQLRPIPGWVPLPPDVSGKHVADDRLRVIETTSERPIPVPVTNTGSFPPPVPLTPEDGRSLANDEAAAETHTNAIDPGV